MKKTIGYVRVSSGEVLEIPLNIVEFHNEELIENRERAVVSDFYKEWIEAGGSTPKYNECVGYKVPLYLGGEDTLSNLDITDVDVYWTIFSQLI